MWPMGRTWLNTISTMWRWLLKGVAEIKRFQIMRDTGGSPQAVRLCLLNAPCEIF